MLKGFKDFILRGNVIDLAVGVAIASAFTAVITSFTKNIINPLISSIGGSNVNGLGYQINKHNPNSVLRFDNLINDIITFLITAAVIYFVLVMPMNKFAERRRIRAGLPAVEEAPVTEADLLTEIRDLLRTRA